jgi:hypothetical protein
MSSARIHYTFHSDATPERELDALVAVYTLALRKFYESNMAAEPAPEHTRWETYMSINPPKTKKKSKVQEAQEEAAKAADTPASVEATEDLTEAEWAQA